MPRSSRSFTGAALAALVLIAPAPSAADDWKVLFDGKSTDAWRGYSRDAFPAGCWVIEGDTLKTVSGGKQPCDLVTREPYRDFDLELEYKLTPGGNSGVLYRVAELPGEPSWHSGPEMQILDDDKYKQNSPKNWTGALYDMIAASSDKVVKPVGEWNKVRVLVKDNHVEHWLNGKKVVEYDLGSDTLTASSPPASSRICALRAGAGGYIALQHHEGGTSGSATSACAVWRCRLHVRRACSRQGRGQGHRRRLGLAVQRQGLDGLESARPGALDGRRRRDPRRGRDQGIRLLDREDVPQLRDEGEVQGVRAPATAASSITRLWTAWTSRACRSRWTRTPACTRAAPLRERGAAGWIQLNEGGGEGPRRRRMERGPRRRA